PHTRRHRRARLHPCVRPGRRPCRRVEGPAGRGPQPERQPGHRLRPQCAGSRARFRSGDRTAFALRNRAAPPGRHRAVLCRHQPGAAALGLARETLARTDVRRCVALAESQSERVRQPVSGRGVLIDYLNSPFNVSLSTSFGCVGAEAALALDGGAPSFAPIDPASFSWSLLRIAASATPDHWIFQSMASNGPDNATGTSMPRNASSPVPPWPAAVVVSLARAV